MPDVSEREASGSLTRGRLPRPAAPGKTTKCAVQRSSYRPPIAAAPQRQRPRGTRPPIECRTRAMLRPGRGAAVLPEGGRRYRLLRGAMPAIILAPCRSASGLGRAQRSATRTAVRGARAPLAPRRPASQSDFARGRAGAQRMPLRLRRRAVGPAQSNAGEPAAGRIRPGHPWHSRPGPQELRAGGFPFVARALRCVANPGRDCGEPASQYCGGAPHEPVTLLPSIVVGRHTAQPAGAPEHCRTRRRTTTRACAPKPPAMQQAQARAGSAGAPRYGPCTGRPQDARAHSARLGPSRAPRWRRLVRAQNL